MTTFTATSPLGTQIATRPRSGADAKATFVAARGVRSAAAPLATYVSRSYHVEGDGSPNPTTGQLWPKGDQA